MVEERIDGSMLITHKDVNLRFKEIASRPKREQQEGAKIHTPNKAYVPAKDHPWRKFRIPGWINSKEKQQALEMLFKKSKTGHFYFGLTKQKFSLDKSFVQAYKLLILFFKIRCVSDNLKQEV